MAPLLIDTASALDAFCAQIAGEPWLALDTEFMREKTYYPNFCLIQIASPSVSACIDPIRLNDLEPLYRIVYDPNIVKVLHACRQDLEIFFHLRNKIPAPIFDTQLAAPLIGMHEQLGYAGLIAEVLGIQLHKGHSRTDWAQRPLSEEQLRYAADDVIYLAQAYPLIKDRLAASNRLEWLETECASLTRNQTYETAPEQAWKRVSGVTQLRSKALKVFKSIAAWREETARCENLPRGWVIKDDAALDLARQQPVLTEKLKQVRGLDDRFIKRYGATVCRIIEQALQQPAAAETVHEKPAARPANIEALLDALTAIVRLIAEQNKLSAGLLASRKDIELFISGDSESRLMQGWRAQLAAETLRDFLDGKTRLAARNSTLALTGSHDG